MPKCHQCDKRAAVFNRATNIWYCLDHWEQFNRILQAENDHLAREMNFLVGLMEATVGIPGILPRIRINQPNIHHHHGSVTMNKIDVNRSVVGAINTGEIARLNVSLEHITVGGDDALAKALRDFTETVITERQLSAEERNRLIEYISFLAEQAALAKEQRKPGMVRKVMSDVADTITIASATLTPLWNQLHSLLQVLLS